MIVERRRQRVVGREGMMAFVEESVGGGCSWVCGEGEVL